MNQSLISLTKAIIYFYYIFNFYSFISHSKGVAFLKNYLTILSLLNRTPLTTKQYLESAFASNAFSIFLYAQLFLPQLSALLKLLAFTRSGSPPSICSSFPSLNIFYYYVITQMSSPQPCLRPQAHEPRNLFQRLHIIQPLPCLISFSYSPRQRIPLGQKNYPTPFICPLFHYPLYTLPLNQVYVPLPQKKLLLKSPLQCSKNLTLRIWSITKFQLVVIDLGRSFGPTHGQSLFNSSVSLFQKATLFLMNSFAFVTLFDGSFSLSASEILFYYSSLYFSQAREMSIVNVPLPFFQSFSKSPSYEVSLNFYIPLPFFLPPLNYPEQLQVSSPSLTMQKPFPSSKPFTKFPLISVFRVKLRPSPFKQT